MVSAPSALSLMPLPPKIVMTLGRCAGIDAVAAGRRRRSSRPKRSRLRPVVEVTSDRVVAGATIDGVGPAAASDDVVAAIAVDGIGAGPAGDGIGPISAVIDAVTAEDRQALGRSGRRRWYRCR